MPRIAFALLPILILCACASRIQPRLDAGLGAGWNDGPTVGGNLGLGKYEMSLAAPPLAGPAPVLPAEPGASSSPPLLPAPSGDVAGPDSCAGGACALPGPTAAPAPAPAGDGGVPVGVWVGGGLAVLLVVGLSLLGLAKQPAAVKS